MYGKTAPNTGRTAERRPQPLWRGVKKAHTATLKAVCLNARQGGAGGGQRECDHNKRLLSARANITISIQWLCAKKA